MYLLTEWVISELCGKAVESFMSVEGLLRMIKPIYSLVQQIFTEYIFCPRHSTQSAWICSIEQKITTAQHIEV